MRKRIGNWATRTLQFSAAIEALLDHADEDDIAAEAGLLDQVRADARTLAVEIEALLAEPGIERLRDGIRVVLAGSPNAGKSTLLNALVGREAAIVSPLAGTTRDRIEAPVMRDGVAYLLTDTAGLHDAPSDMVEEIGIVRAKEALDQADLILWLDDVPPPALTAPHILIHPRTDEPGRGAVVDGRLRVSARTGEGMAQLWERIAELAGAMLPTPDAIPFNRRQRDLAALAAASLRGVAEGSDLLLIAEELRRALRAFDRITGAADVEAMLDTLFGRFCIGK